MMITMIMLSINMVISIVISTTMHSITMASMMIALISIIIYYDPQKLAYCLVFVWCLPVGLVFAVGKSKDGSSVEALLSVQKKQIQDVNI